MKRKSKMLLALSMICMCSCQSGNNTSSSGSIDATNSSESKEITPMENVINQDTMFLGNIIDQTTSDGSITYKMKAHVSDEYSFFCSNSKEIKIYNNEWEEIVSTSDIEGSVTLVKDEIYYVNVKTVNPNEQFDLSIFPINNKIITPYETDFKVSASDYNGDPVSSNPLVPAKLEVTPREGGTYLYSNMPESMPSEVINTVIMENYNLTGECFLTYEHQNRTGNPNIYMGYKIANNEDHDIYVTVTNVGLQNIGSWLGEKSWMDYYGVKYDMDTSSFDKTAQDWFNSYLAFDTNYNPNPIKATTYKLPAGKHMYVIGGTTSDSYNNINVHETADHKILTGHCVNGNVKFIINGGTATGQLCVYDDIEKINSKDVVIQNYRKYGEDDDFGGRQGYSPVHGVIDSNPVWEFNDSTPQDYLPVKYDVYYNDTWKEDDVYEPGTVIETTSHQYEGYRWYTHLSSQYHHNYIGSDMIKMITYEHGSNKEVILDTDVANGAGKIWDYGNWMIEYQDNCTFVNHGDSPRRIKFFVLNNGSIFYQLKDENNNILNAGATMITCTGRKEAVEITVEPHSVKQVSFQYVLPANNNGSIEHYVQLMAR